MMDEKKIIKEIKSGGGSKNFRILYDYYFDTLFHFIYRYVKSYDTAKEIAHDAFVKLWLHRHSLDETRSVRAYLFTICRNQLIKEFRRQIRNPLLRNYIDFTESLSVESKIYCDFDTYVNAINDAAEHLSPRQREIFFLNRREGLPVQEIAERLSISEQVVRNQLSAATKKVKSVLMTMMSD